MQRRKKAMKRKVQRQVKDRLFRFLFEKDKEALLQLYNALNGTDYQDASELQVVTIESAVYVVMKNDLAFVLAGTLNLYGMKQIFLPTPQCVVFYNGEKEAPEEQILRLSDAFENKEKEFDVDKYERSLKNEGIEIGIQQGVQQGIQQGTERINKLNCLLLEQNRIADLKRAIQDAEYQEQLFREFNL